MQIYFNLNVALLINVELKLAKWNHRYKGRIYLGKFHMADMLARRQNAATAHSNSTMHMQLQSAVLY